MRKSMNGIKGRPRGKGSIASTEEAKKKKQQERIETARKKKQREQRLSRTS